MNMPFRARFCKAAFPIALAILPLASQAAWQRDSNSIAWLSGSNVVWQFSFDPKSGKPYFHPLSPAGGESLTNFKPEDHPWHYGLWFSWKYINGTNYWEEDRKTGLAEGSTRWNKPTILTRPDGRAIIRLLLTYKNSSGRLDMAERRELRISAPTPEVGYTIDWQSQFIAGKDGAVLDRTPLLGEPNGKVNGGYAGLGARLASAPVTMSVLCSTGPVTHFESDRARPNGPALACNFTRDDKPLGSIAFFSDPANAGPQPPWYVINSAQMRFACAAILAPKPRTIPPNGRLDLRYHIVVRSEPWTVEELKQSPELKFRGP